MRTVAATAFGMRDAGIFRPAGLAAPAGVGVGDTVPVFVGSCPPPPPPVEKSIWDNSLLWMLVGGVATWGGSVIYQDYAKRR